MQDRSSRGVYRLLTVAVGLTACLALAAPAAAQFTPRTLDDPATGETYHIEGAIGLWSPSANVQVSSDYFGIPGTSVDLHTTLGIEDKKFPDISLVLKGGKKHKLRFGYIPIVYENTAGFTPPSDIIFNGQRFSRSLPVSSRIDFAAYNLAYEYDFIARDRGFGGVILNFKYYDFAAQLANSTAGVVSTPQPLPVPTLGGIARVYVVPNISITFEATGIKIPESLGETVGIGGHDLGIQLYGTLNFTNNVGVQVGYRSLDMGVDITVDDPTRGSFVMRGVLFGVVARF